ncbi:MAG: 1-phosphofructokinase family hexose kinase [Candidatus Fimadaptatus sp.]
MITCVCMNPAMDKTIELDGFNYGGLNRVKRSMLDATGKAVNVAIVLSRLGEEARLVGINYREGGRAVEARLAGEGAQSEFIWLNGALRVNIKALDTRTGRMTEINDSGAPVTPEAAGQAAALIERSAEDSRYVALTGSLPPGVQADFYRRIVERVGDRARCVLDCDGERLSEGIKARPFLIKPNQYELGLLCGRELSDRGEIVACAREIARAGVRWVAVSLGGEGAVLVSEQEAWYAPALDVPVRSTVGAGDSMVAGLIYGFMRDDTPISALSWGVGCGNASVMTEGTRLIDTDALPGLMAQVRPERI